SPTNATVPGGSFAYNDSYQFGLPRTVMTNNDGRAYTYSASINSLGLACSAGTDAVKDNAVSAVAASGTLPSEKLWYDCNGALMSRSQTAGSTTTRSSYAFDAAGRLDAVATGTPVTWTNQVGVTDNSSTNDLASSSTLPGTGWDGGASSSQVITGDGAMSFRFRENPDAPYIAGLN